MPSLLASCLYVVAFAAVVAGYHPVLDNFFFPVDDPTLIWSVQNGEPPTPHFRPLYTVWNRLLLALCGTEPGSWYAAGLLVHLASAFLVGHLGRRLTASDAGVVAGVVFAALYSPNEAVLWVAANCGLCVVLFVLLAAVAWDAWLERGGAARYLAALAALLVAMGFKEECVLAGPLFLALDAARNGWRRLLSLRHLRVYVPFALAAAAYLAVAFRPSLWEESGDVGEYGIGLGLVPELFQNVAWILWPRATEMADWGYPSAAVGAAVMAVALLFASRAKTEMGGRAAGVGVAVLVCAMLPVLPGPFAVAGTRYAYPGAIGVALVVGGMGAWVWARVGGLPRGSRAAARSLLAGGLAAWLAVQVLSLHSVERWRFEAKCDRLSTLVETSRALPDRPAGAPAIVLGPAVRNAHDYVTALRVWLDLPPHRVSLAWEELAGLDTHLEFGGALDARLGNVFACQPSGEVAPLTSSSVAPWALWEEQAASHEERGRGRTIAAVRVFGR